VVGHAPGGSYAHGGSRFVIRQFCAFAAGGSRDLPSIFA
jgi:hypothetical protein